MGVQWAFDIGTGLEKCGLCSFRRRAIGIQVLRMEVRDLLGYITYPAPRFDLEEIRVGGAAFWQVSLPAGWSWWTRWQIRWAAWRLRRLRVSRAVFPVDFPYTEVFARRGIAPVSDLALRRAVAVETLVSRLREAGLKPKRAAVAVYAAGPSSDVAELLRELAVQVRYLTLWAGGGGEELAHELRWESGVSIRVVEREDLFREAQGAVLLREPPPELTPPPASLALWEGSRGEAARYFSLPEAVGDPDPEQLAAALFAAGRLRKEDFSSR